MTSITPWLHVSTCDKFLKFKDQTFYLLILFFFISWSLVWERERESCQLAHFDHKKVIPEVNKFFLKRGVPLRCSLAFILFEKRNWFFRLIFHFEIDFLYIFKTTNNHLWSLKCFLNVFRWKKSWKWGFLSKLQSQLLTTWSDLNDPEIMWLL